MRKPELSLVQLAVLEAVARHGGIGTAAQAIGLSQPSVSNHVSQIEGRLRTRLFDRQGNRFVANARLAVLLPKIQALLALSDEVDAHLRGHEELTGGFLRIGYSTHQFVMGVLGRFIARHPAVRIEARSAGSYELLASLRRGDIEAAFITLGTPEPGLDALEMRREEVVLMARRGSDLARRGSIGWEEIGALTLIRREEGSGTRRAFDAMVTRLGVAPARGLDLGSWESMREAVAQGLGLGIAMRGEIEPDDTRVAAVRIGPPQLELGHYLVALPELRQTAQVSALYALAADPAA
jgi:DNA-binding transcriptional LysR family regulator